MVLGRRWFAFGLHGKALHPTMLAEVDEVAGLNLKSKSCVKSDVLLLAPGSESFLKSLLQVSKPLLSSFCRTINLAECFTCCEIK